MSRICTSLATFTAVIALAACSSNSVPTSPGSPPPAATPTPTPPPTATGFVLAGVSREAGPGSPALSNVRIAIVRGADAGAAATSDTGGAFRLDGVDGVVDVEASKSGFILWRVGNLTVDHDMSLDVVLYPTPPTNAAGDTASARCNDGSWTFAHTVGEACTANGGIMYGVCPGILCAATRGIR